MTKEVITVRLHPDTLKELNAISENMKINRTAVIQLALNQFIKQHEDQKNVSTDSHLRT